MPKRSARRRLPEILEDADNGLSVRFRAELHELAEELRHLDARVSHYDEQIETVGRQDAQVQRLVTIPGLGRRERPLWWPPSARTRRCFATAAAWPSGSVWCRASMPPADASGCLASASAEMSICADC